MAVRIQHDDLIDGMDPLEQACRTVEAHVNGKGWDQMPSFYMLSLVGDYKTADLNEIDAKRVPGGLLTVEVNLPEFCYTDPATGLLKFLRFMTADVVAHGEERTKEMALVLNQLVPPYFFGFGMVYEAWGIVSDSKDEVERAAAERNLSLHPDRYELRGMHVATRDGRFVSLSRTRGEIPEFMELDPTDQNMILEGQVPDAIRLCTSFFVEFDNWRNRVTEGEEMEPDNES